MEAGCAEPCSATVPAPTAQAAARELKARVQHHFGLLVGSGLPPNEAAAKAIDLARAEEQHPTRLPIAPSELDRLPRDGGTDLCAGNVPLNAWMAHLPEEGTHRSLCELALPGAHNAGASQLKSIPAEALAKYVGAGLAGNPLVAMFAQPVATAAAICQDVPIRGLLSAGIRVLDLRVGLHEDEIHICHTVVCGTTFLEALEQIAEFLRSEQSELVAVIIKRDWEHPGFDTVENWETLQACVMSVLDDLLIGTVSEMALPLCELRRAGRRALVLLDLPPAMDLVCGIRLTSESMQKSWTPDMKSVEDLKAILAEWRRSGKITPKPGQLKLLETALPGAPASSAPAALAAFRSFLAEGEPVHIGALMDFPDEATVRAILAGNW